MDKIRICLRLSCPVAQQAWLGKIIETRFPAENIPRSTQGPAWAIWRLNLCESGPKDVRSAMEELRQDLADLVKEAMADPESEADLLVMLHGRTAGTVEWSAEDIAFLAAHRISLHIDFYQAP